MRLTAFLLASLACCATPTKAQSPSDAGAIIDGRNGWDAIDCMADCVAGLKRRAWFALVAGNDGWTLRPAHLRFPDGPDDAFDADVPGATFYLAHPALVAGHASTPDLRFKDKPRPLSAATLPLRVDFHGHRHEIVARGSTVLLRTDGRDTVIGDLDAAKDDESTLSLLWAGDLDGDGRLDLILESTTSKNATICLLLSSAGRPSGALVADVGCQFFSG